MKEKLRHLLAQEYIEDFGILSLADTKIIHPHLLPKDSKSVIIFAVPYDLGAEYSDGVSAYAHIRDYHRYFRELFDRLLPKLRAEYPDESFFGFADHSPIAEKDAGAKAGLGVLGKNSLLIHSKYGSYVFLGSIITSKELISEKQNVNYCMDCGRCKAICPAKAVSENGIDPMLCLSAVSQKKSPSDEELQALKANHIAWGCDLCQKVCPHNENRVLTKIPYFAEQRHGPFFAHEIEQMSNEEFEQYAFSWRGKNRILQNLQNIAVD